MRVYGDWQTHVPEARGDRRDKRPAYVSPLCTLGKVAGSVRRLSTVTFFPRGLG